MDYLMHTVKHHKVAVQLEHLSLKWRPDAKTVHIWGIDLHFHRLPIKLRVLSDEVLDTRFLVPAATAV